MTGRVFDRIYEGNLWRGVESRSGPGSGPAATRLVASSIVGLVDGLGARTVLDIGCGDGAWMPDLPGYVGFDVAPRALALARERHPRRTYTATWVDLPFDLVICRDVMQHLALEDAVDLLERIRATGSEFLLASTYQGGENVRITTGEGAYSPDLEASPFNLGRPERAIFDGYHYHETGTDEVRDASKFLGLWPLRRGGVEGVPRHEAN